MPIEATRNAVLLLIFALSAATLPAQTQAQAQDTESDGAQTAPTIATRVYDTRRIASEPPVVDGVLNDPVWNTVEWSGNFIQRDPTDGEPPTQQSRFKVVYDDSALYFGFRLEDDPGLMRPILARRDHFPGDWIEVNIDSYQDRRTAFSFTLSLSGTRSDELISNDGDDWDSNWNPVWDGAARVDGEGWTAEMRIPLSQLRFSSAAQQSWGLQVHRRLFRLEERSTWQRIPKGVDGWVSRFGELRGLDDLQPKRRIELTPYGVASGESFEAEPGNPFRDGSDDNLDGGLDGKLGITSNLTLDFTVNPDFGQVEADPSEVNLSAFETFFDERRPFFIEGKEIFDLRLAPATTGGDFTRDTLFYSRRIGRPPGHDPDLPDEAYVDVPGFTRILGAFKLSGKTASGLSLGLLESVTAKEEAAVDLDGERSRLTVEPLTSYFVGRVQQDFEDGDTQIGGMVTAVSRELDDDHLNAMRREAYALGLDFGTYFKNRDYRLEANLLGSEIRGSQEAILEAQESSARYYQRPGNDSATLDPTRESLAGHSGSVRFTRTSNHELMFQTGVAWRSPGFEINDVGFMRNADQINQFTWVGYSKRNPFSIFDRWQLNGNQWLDWDYAGNFLGARYNVNTNAQFKNKYHAGASITRRGESTSNSELRGGPASRWPGSWAYEAWVNSDERRDLRVNLGGYVRRTDDGGGDSRQAWATFSYRPTNAIRLSLSPEYSRNRPELQYIDTVAFAEDERYIFGRLDQETLVLTTRLDYTITPNLTVQLYAAPFVSYGRYSEFKRITDPVAGRYRDRFLVFGAEQIAFDAESETFEVDEDGNGTVDYDFDGPDFDARFLNANVVVRWEYTPGSTVFVVWTQSRESSDLLAPDGDFQEGLDDLFSVEPEDIFLVKFSKWLAF
ncbi:MAG: carbohydrate binding family 9 domain-containing protein [bacterium]|nr:carbohydrate binding family 9 domain-containing protein [bacterium]